MALLFYYCFFVLIKAWLTEGCSTSQQGLTTVSVSSSGLLPASDSFQPLPFNVTCQWHIKAPQGKVLRIEVQIATFIEPCSEAYLKIFDGSSTSSKMIIEYCNRRSLYKHSFISSTNSVLFKVKSGVWNSTFLTLFYETLGQEECSANTTLDAPLWPVEHNFSSPYWPLGYRVNQTCGWYIKAPKDHTVGLSITSHLFEFRKNAGLQVFDVTGTELSLIESYRRDFKMAFSKGQFIFIMLKTDDISNTELEKGVFINYTSFLPGKTCSASNTFEQNRNIVLKARSGVINSPGFPSNYLHSVMGECVWKIIAPKGHVIQVSFSSFALYRYDCIYVVAGINKANPVIGTYCGSKVSFTVFSSGPELELRTSTMYTDDTGPGFIANYTVLPAASSGICNMSENSIIQLTGEGRSFFTPGYPINPGKGSCSWNITVPDGMFVRLMFKVRTCDRSYAEAFDGPSFTSKSFGKLCKLYQYYVLYSSGEHLLVRFKYTERKWTDSGMIAYYEAIPAVPVSYACSENTRVYESIELDGLSNNFASYNYPLKYPNTASCVWSVQSPVGYYLEITFHSFNLQASNNCQADYLEIRKTRQSWPSRVINRFCGSSPPNGGVVTSNRSNLFVEFASDMSGRYYGFNATLVARPNPLMGMCKNQGVDNIIRLTNTTGKFSSPMFPLSYPERMTCTWIITVPEGQFVKLRMNSFQLYISCDDAFLEIRDGESYTSKLLNTFCRSNYFTSVFSSGQHLWVRFKSIKEYSDTWAFSGFSAEFEAVKEVPASFACTASNLRRQLTSDSGTLASYNYPLPADAAIQCEWTITVSNDEHIQLSFDSFHVSESDSDCEDGYVEVRDGPFDTSDLIGKYCGTDKPSTITSDNWDLHITFKSSGKKRYPGFKASYKTKKSVGYIMKIVGICVGSVAALLTIIGGCCKYCSSRNDYVPPEPTTTADTLALQEDTKV